METLEIIKTLLDLGLSAILIYFIKVVWEDRKETIEKKDQKIQEKDNNAKELGDKVLKAFEENTKSNVELRATISQHVETTRTLTQYVYDALKK